MSSSPGDLLSATDRAAVALGATLGVAAALLGAPLWGSILIATGGIVATKKAIEATNKNA